MSDPIDYSKGPFEADKMGGYIWSLANPGERFMYAQVRGWGRLQYKNNGAEVQDAHLQFMVDALNEKSGHKTR